MSNDTATLTLTDFLLARIAEDEERAKFVQREVASGRGPETLEAWKLSWHDEYDLLCVEPERALTECRAKRRILQRATVGTAAGTRLSRDATLVLKGTVRDLASVYADHPDYREEWRP